MRMTKEAFGIDDNEKCVELLSSLVELNVHKLSPAYPEICGNRVAFIKNVISTAIASHELKKESWSIISERFVKKLTESDTSTRGLLTGEQVWRLCKGDGSGNEIDINFIQEWSEKKKIQLDMDGYSRLHSGIKLDI